MRVLTYNIHGWRGAHDQVDVARLARVISASQADVVALNEVFHPFVPPGDSRAALDSLASVLGMQAAFGVAFTPRLAFAPLAAYGNALLTRWPLLAHASHHLTPLEGHEQRGLLEARVLLPDGRTALSIYVTHLDHQSERARLAQLSAALQWTVRDRGRPHLLLGDFNALNPADYQDDVAAADALRSDPDTAHMVEDGMQVVPRLLRSHYVDSFVQSGHGPSPTFPASDPGIRIDYIFASTPLASALRRCCRWETEETAMASDHLPVLAEFDLAAVSAGG